MESDDKSSCGNKTNGKWRRRNRNEKIGNEKSIYCNLHFTFVLFESLSCLLKLVNGVAGEKNIVCRV
jgi:hypothetical protein